jgi:hypothetical protein
MTVPVAWGPLPLAGRLVVNLLDDEGDPVVGAWVILHRADGSVEATKKTNALGKADFGDIGRNTATVSYAYEHPGTLHTYRHIYTAVDIPVAELKILVEDDDDDEGEQPHLFAAEDDGDGPLYSVSLAVASPDIPEEGYVTFQPAYAYLYREYPRQDGVSVYQSHLQEDGKLTLLALARTWNEGSEAQTLHSWGVLYDQTPVSGDLYTVDLTGNPVNVSWTFNVDVTWLFLTAERRGERLPTGTSCGPARRPCWRRPPRPARPRSPLSRPTSTPSPPRGPTSTTPRSGITPPSRRRSASAPLCRRA